MWSDEIKRRRGAKVVEWIDSDVGTEKASVVMVWPRGAADGGDVILVGFRGSKGKKDWLRTNAALINPFRRVVPLSDAAYRQPTGPREEDAVQDSPSVDAPGVPLAWWRAYAGTPDRQDCGPRAVVRSTVERLVEERGGRCEVVVTAHSLGGGLAQLCAYDLLASSRIVRRAGVTALPVAAVPGFNAPFQRHMEKLQRSKELRALHVTCAGDFAPRLFLQGGVHGVLPRLVLNPKDTARPLYYVPSGADDGCRDLLSMAGDDYGHNIYSQYLCALRTTARQQTVPRRAAWPVPCEI